MRTAPKETLSPSHRLPNSRRASHPPRPNSEGADDDAALGDGLDGDGAEHPCGARRRTACRRASRQAAATAKAVGRAAPGGAMRCLATAGATQGPRTPRRRCAREQRKTSTPHTQAQDAARHKTHQGAQGHDAPIGLLGRLAPKETNWAQQMEHRLPSTLDLLNAMFEQTRTSVGNPGSQPRKAALDPQALPQQRVPDEQH